MCASFVPLTSLDIALAWHVHILSFEIMDNPFMAKMPSTSKSVHQQFLLKQASLRASQLSKMTLLFIADTQQPW